MENVPHVLQIPFGPKYDLMSDHGEFWGKKRLVWTIVIKRFEVKPNFGWNSPFPKTAIYEYRWGVTIVVKLLKATTHRVGTSKNAESHGQCRGKRSFDQSSANTSESDQEDET